jgi:CubicO group peptidase (beta-lactamase class C family)
LSEKVFPMLGITSKALPAQMPDPHINDITVDQLVRHAGGWVHTANSTWKGPVSGFDPVFGLRKIGAAMQTGTRPPTKMEIARYMYGEPLQFVPGAQDFGTTKGASYSNFGYVLLGLVVEAKSGQSYADYVRQAVLAPIGVTDVFLAHTLASQRLTNEVPYYAMALGATVENPSASTLLPVTYGGSFMTEDMDAGGGLAATASALVKFINSFAVWGLNGRTPSARTGGMSGTSSEIVSRGDGLDWAFVLNQRDQLTQPTDPAVPDTTLLDTLAQQLDALVTAAGF